MQFSRMNNGSFPNIENVNVNQWVNDFDYSRYNYTQMKITLCAVPWDMGEAHVGNRTISGIGNVVYFGSAEKRDEWFDNIPDGACLRFETKYKELHRDKYIDVPVPFDIAAKYNYIAVEYELFANDDSPIEYENNSGVRKWFWFVREVEFLAPNTTRLYLLDDAFQTWIYSVDISGMMLERGHAPMFQVTADEYLSNPIDNAKWLLADDVNYGNDYIGKHESDFVFNSGEMLALVITSADPFGVWGTKENSNWKTPAKYNYNLQGVISHFAFAINANEINDFLDSLDAYYPQFLQTIKCIAFVSEKLIQKGNEFVFAGKHCWIVDANYKTNDLVKLDKDMFGYSSHYENIAKLYTYPYSYLLITDEQGNQTEVHIETTSGKLEIESTLSLVFPWISVNAHLSGIGKTPRKQISFVNIDSKNMPIQGNWFDTLMSWNIPTFGVIQNAETNNDYGTFYDRQQQKLAADNAYSNVSALASTLTTNAALTASTNSAITATSNSSNASDTAANNAYIVSKTTTDNQVTTGAATATIDAAEQQAAIAAAASVGSGVAGAIGSIATGNIAGAIGGIVGGGIGAAATMASTNVGIALTATQAGQTVNANIVYGGIAGGLNTQRSNIHIAAQSDIAASQNALTTGSAANSAATQLANGARDKSTAYSAIDNQIAQAAMNAPVEFGAWNAGQFATTRPMGLFANVVTQTDAAISKAGDEFLRYGYNYNQYWQFDGNWNIGKYYTYWKLSDFWVNALNVPDLYMDRLRFFLFGGVTVWRDPADIGKIEPWQNLVFEG